MLGVIKIYTVGVALIAGGAVAVAVDAHEELAQAKRTNAAWKGELAQWQTVANQAVAHDRAVTRAQKVLVRRYQTLAAATLAQAKAAATVVSASTSVSGPSAAPASAPAAAAPATKTS